jgi:DNA polymerase I-like protein with 3'-5' exonuclease and polymerase domains
MTTRRLYLDCETVGLNGPAKLIQFSVDRGPIQFVKLFRGWPVDSRTMVELVRLSQLLDDPDTLVVGFNLSFDLYHLYRVFHEAYGLDGTSADRPVQPFLARALDLYTHAVTHGPFAPWAFTKSAGKRVAVVRRIPAVAKEHVAKAVEDELARRLPAGVAVKRSEHRVTGSRELVTLSWITAAPLTLKAHARHYGAQTQAIEDVWPLPRREDERPWLPYAADYEHTYKLIEDQCEAIMAGTGPATDAFYRYAADDIRFLWLVEDGLGCPAPTHHDASVEIVAYTRYYGFPLDRDVLLKTQAEYKRNVDDAERQLAGINLRSSVQKLAALKKFEPWLTACNKNVLTALVRDGSTQAAPLARAMLQYGKSKQRLDQVNKLLESATGRAHPSLRAMGTATGRMAGADGLNFQGIAPAVKLADGSRIGIRAAIKSVLGGDFSAFEVAIAASAWHDTQLLADLDAGVDVHLMTAVTVHPDVVKLGLTYDDAVKVRKDKAHPHHDLLERARNDCKRIVFGLIYGCGPEKVEEVLGLPPGRGQEILDRFFGRYQGLGAFRAREERRFQTADTERWTAGSVADMAREAQDLLGFKRRFHFECDLADAFWQLGHTGVKTGLAGTVTRNQEKGPQTIDNAIRSALLGAALAIQAAVCRQAINMPVQATGANLNKLLAERIWRRLHCPMLNVHDEQQFPAHANLNVDRVFAVVREFEAEYRSKVKHIAFDLKRIECWADKA